MEAEALRIFNLAMDQPKETREAWIRATCGGNQELTLAVLALHAADQKSANELPTGGAHQHINQLADGQQFGRYQIQGLIGAGGMGAVYKANRSDGEFDQTVAIKIIAPHSTTEIGRMRFLNERQILAQLEHPHIARLIDGGTDQGLAYIVMEYVEGVPLLHDSARPLEQTLRLFGNVCSAVSYAHNNLVLHRDIKPENVLVTDDGDAKLLDFGVAKINQTLVETSDEDLTGIAAAPLTPNYAAPERLAGEPATVASDVYSLGIYLHLLVTGERPYDVAGLSYPEAHKHIATQTQTRHTDELQTLIHTAMHPDPSRRYASVAALMDDLDRFQTGRPLLAKGDDWRYSVRKALQRNKALFAVSSVSLIALIGALIYSLNQTAIAQYQQRQAENTGDFLNSIFIAADPYTGMPLGQDSTLREMLRNAELLIETVPDDSPDLKLMLVIRLVSIYTAVQDLESARRLQHLGDTIINDHADIEASQRVEFDATKIITQMGFGEITTAAESCERLDLHALTGLSAAYSTIACGTVAFRSGDKASARDMAMKAQAMLDNSRPETPNVEYAKAVAQLSELVAVAGTADEYMDLVNDAINIAEDIGDVTRPLMSYLYLSKSIYFNQLGDAEQALKFTTLAINTAEKSKLSRDGVMFANAQIYHADRLIDMNQLEEAERYLAPAKASLLVHAPQMSHFYSLIYFTEYKLYFKKREFGIAEEALLTFKSIRQSGGEAYVDWHAAADNGLGKIYTETKRYDEAIPLLEKALEYYLGAYGPDHPRVLRYTGDLERAKSLKQVP